MRFEERDDAAVAAREHALDVGLFGRLDVDDDVLAPAQRLLEALQALLYGLAMTFEPDPYSFWHSEQTGEFESNFSMFGDKRADELLSNARETLDANVRSGMYREFQEILAGKMPAVFLYSPTYLYVTHQSVRGFSAIALIFRVRVEVSISGSIA